MRNKFILFTLFVALASCSSKQKQFFISGTVQGSYFRITYTALSEDTTLINKVSALLDTFDNTFSLWNNSSMLVRVNRNENVDLSPLFIDLFNKSQIMSQRTNGYFDITVKPLVSLYGFAAEKRAENFLSLQEIDLAKRHVGYSRVRVKDSRIEKDLPQIELDFNAIAQGYCSDLVAELLFENGYKNFLVNIGGEIVVNGCKPNGEAWKIGIEKPTATANEKQSIMLQQPLTNGSIVTSGNYRKYFEIDGKRFSHTINPHTGKPTSDGILSVTVIAMTGWEADALATAIMCMGKDTAITYAKRNNVRCMIIYDSSQNVCVWQSKQFNIE
jgi:thiamine biosynthesis lipoprotein